MLFRSEARSCHSRAPREAYVPLRFALDRSDRLTRSFCCTHTDYAEHVGKPFFAGLVKYMASGPVVGMVWEGLDAVKTGRVMLGATNPLASAPGQSSSAHLIDVI